MLTSSKYQLCWGDKVLWWNGPSDVETEHYSGGELLRCSRAARPMTLHVTRFPATDQRYIEPRLFPPSASAPMFKTNAQDYKSMPGES